MKRMSMDEHRKVAARFRELREQRGEPMGPWDRRATGRNGAKDASGPSRRAKTAPKASGASKGKVKAARRVDRKRPIWPKGARKESL